MLKRFKAVRNGLQYKFLRLVTGIVVLVLSIQLGIDSYKQFNEARSESLTKALSVTNVIARSLEKQFDLIELDDIESILASVRKRSDVAKLSVVDKHKTFFLDGDPLTSPIVAIDNSEVQMKALENAKTSYEVTPNSIEVGEPLLARGDSIGAVVVSFHLPSWAETIIPIMTSKAMALLPIILIGLILTASLARQITAPISKLSKNVLAISEGDMEVEVVPEGTKEIHQLGTSFNQMVSKLKDNIAQIYDLAYVDKVTHLPNREYFRKELSGAISSTIQDEKSGALLFLDLDGFKRVNDTFGHDFGDRLLEQFSLRLKQLVRNREKEAENLDKSHNPRKSDVIARLGGDEFTILLAEIRTETDAALVARRIISAMKTPFKIDGKDISVGVSIGIAAFPRDGHDYQTIMRHADMAMYQAKEEGKNTVRFYSDELNKKTKNRMEIEIDLRRAIEEKELELFYQPKINVVEKRADAVEALIRWHHPEKGMINPNDFISVAEETGQIMQLGQYVIETACKQIVEFEKQGRDISIAVNISMRQFESSDFTKVIKTVLKKTGANPKLLELEITESMAMSNVDTAISHITKLKKIGVRFAIDDFGTGYSNLSQLSSLPFDVFKIDRSFVNAMTISTGNDCNVIVKTITAMAHSLNYETVAEGVETKEQLDELIKIGCEVMQGYYFAKPMPIKDLNRWLENDAKQIVGSLSQKKAA